MYLDASVIVPLFVTEAKSAVVRRWLQGQTETLAIGRLAIGEFGSAVSRRRRMSELTDEQGKATLALFDDWLSVATTIVDHQPADLIEAASLVRHPRPKLLTPDAIHLATCRRLGHRFITDDRGIVTVAQSLGIACERPA